LLPKLSVPWVGSLSRTAVSVSPSTSVSFASTPKVESMLSCSACHR